MWRTNFLQLHSIYGSYKETPANFSEPLNLSMLGALLLANH
jgi:hypothetical protein